MIEGYLKERPNLKAVTLILDIRRIPGVEERNFIDWLQAYNIPVILILTKADKLSKNRQNNQVSRICSDLGVGRGQVTLFSAKSRLGKEALWRQIAALVAPETFKDESDGPHD